MNQLLKSNAMFKTAKIAISLPSEVLDAVERERDQHGESRSQFFRRAVETLLRQQQEKELSEQYIRAYQKKPETADEIAAARSAASTILAEELWA
jgi:metal-responsive CopG/Arc/MetJ family transcriptional regulator